MRLRLLKNNNGDLEVLCSNGYMMKPDKAEIRHILFDFNRIEKVEKSIANSESANMWFDKYPDIVAYPGETLAYVTDNLQLVIIDFAPFSILFEQSETVFDDFITVLEYAEMHDKSVEQIKVFCRKGRIVGAKKVGRDWLIPRNAMYPRDTRLKSNRTVSK